MEINKETLIKLKELIDNKEKINCKLVVISKKTNKDNTYLIKGNPKGGNVYFLDIRYEIDYNTFKKCAYHFHNTNYLSEYYSTTNPIIQGAYWLLKELMHENYDFILERAIIKHTGTCMKCGRELTDNDSIEFGMGYVCRNK